MADDMKRLIRDAKRTPWLLVEVTGGTHIRIRRSNGGGPIVITSGSHCEGRSFQNLLAELRRNAMLPKGWERRKR